MVDPRSCRMHTERLKQFVVALTVICCCILKPRKLRMLTSDYPRILEFYFVIPDFSCANLSWTEIFGICHGLSKFAVEFEWRVWFIRCEKMKPV